ncbi:MAG: hemolysin family protein [Candidatus Omnitrophica bacterium]|nr:hemolysin family protein [Candidatus Omnitrophota bacterium]MDD5429980.1 hemolysin family protein [Candidatus Omnitrophota bacterium]
MPNMIMAVSLIVLFIFLSAFFSASETAIFSLSNLRLRRLSERNPKAKAVKSLLKYPTRLLSAIVFGNLLVNIGLSSLIAAVFVKSFGKNGLILAVFLSSTLILLFGEIFPKTFAIYLAEKVSLACSPFLVVFSKVFSPVILLIERCAGYFSSFIFNRQKRLGLSDEEFKAALVLSKKDGQISAQEEKMISHVLEFKETQASEIVTARIDIEGINSGLSQEEVINILKNKKHSKFPVYEGSLDNITGVLYAKDIFLNPERDYHEFLHEPAFIPESKGIDNVLKMFLEEKKRVAVVLDEYGGTEGLITLEDVVEEIFGELYDEFETPQEHLEKIGEKKWKVYGKTSIKAFNLGVEACLPEEEDTIAGFLLSRLERIPRSGEKFSFQLPIVCPKGEALRQDVDFFIERATARRIVSVIVTIPQVKL